MERLNLHLVRELASQFSITICGPVGSSESLQIGSSIAEAPLRPLSRFLVQNAFQAIQLARRIRPQLVFAGSGLTVPAALAAGRVCSAPVVAYLHGLDIVAAHWLYRLVWWRSLRHLDAAFVNSHHTSTLAAAAGISHQKIRIVHPGVHIPDYDSHAAKIFRCSFNLDERPLILSVGRLTARKGLVQFVTEVMPQLIATHPALVLVVIGGEATEALGKYAEAERERLLRAAEVAGVADNVRLLGVQEDSVVSGAMWASSALVFPALALPGDVEGFGMVALEAAAHGLPTVAFAVGGLTDAVSDPTSGRLISPGDYSAMADSLSAYLKATPDADAAQARVAYARRLDWSVFGEKLRNQCMEAVANG
jgi:phosphatidylinositol alpha-1,6-mannosyltransferase